MDLGRVEARLQSLGLGQLVASLPHLEEEVELSFASAEVAARVQRLLYKWLWFHPQVKEAVSLRLDKEAATLTILPRAVPERRGRRPKGRQV